MFNRAVEDGLVRSNPFAGSVRGKTQRRASRFWTPAEIQAMTNAAPTLWWRAFIQTAVSTGLRRNELLSLHWSDIDVPLPSVPPRADRGATLVVTRKVAGSFTVDGEDFPILPFSTKSHQERSVPLDDRTLGLLEQLRAEDGRSRYVFLNLDRLRTIKAKMRSGKWTPVSLLMNNLPRGFQTIQRRALGKDAVYGCVHDLRRTYGNTMKSHVSCDVLQKLMGHADISTTIAYYTGTTAEDSARVRAALKFEFGVKNDTEMTPEPEMARTA